MKHDREFIDRVRQQYSMLTRLIGAETGTRQLFLATETYRYYKNGEVYDLVRRDIISFLRLLGLADRIKKIMAEHAKKPEEYEKMLRNQFVGAPAAERSVPLKTIQLYMETLPERAEGFDRVLTARDRELLKSLSL